MARRPELDLRAFVLARIQVDEQRGCWLWTSKPDDRGYGNCRPAILGYKTYKAHRLAYEVFVGPIADGLVIDHLCRVRHCVNPNHLEPVTQRVNILRGATISAIAAARTHCPQGHPLVPVPEGVPGIGRRLRRCTGVGCPSRRGYKR